MLKSKFQLQNKTSYRGRLSVLLHSLFICNASRAVMELFQHGGAVDLRTVMQLNMPGWGGDWRSPMELLLTGKHPVQLLQQWGVPAHWAFSQRCLVWSLSQSMFTSVQERLRSSWVPTSILLYSFCCSSLKVSFTFSRFSPPSLKTKKKGFYVRFIASVSMHLVWRKAKQLPVLVK